MPGFILREDVDAVRERASIEQVVGAQVALSPAGIGSLKGLCPFHDEKSASFFVRSAIGRYHCFGCGEGGDVFNFVQKTTGLSFSEAVAHLASQVGIQLRYEQGGRNVSESRDNQNTRQRALAANKAAELYFTAQLLTAEAKPARQFLNDRMFDRQAADLFGVGFAPPGWDNLTRHLTGKGYTTNELLAAGLVTQRPRGVYDRFRGRVIWPIRDTTGATIGFGARELPEFLTDKERADRAAGGKGAKYLNTPETSLYKKSHVLFGLDLAKDAIRQQKRVVIVEGYTDVMAARLSGIDTAVATCGTAFGSEHAKIIRRLMGDHVTGGGLQLADGASLGGEIIFTFDGDAAGQQAAMKAFGEDQRFHAQTFVAVAANGMDPCDLRIAQGPEAVKALVAGREPLFAFVIRSTLRKYDLNTVEGRVEALRATAPIVARIRDEAYRANYARELAGWIGIDVEQVRREVSRASRAVSQASKVVPPLPGALPRFGDAGAAASGSASHGPSASADSGRGAASDGCLGYAGSSGSADRAGSASDPTPQQQFRQTASILRSANPQVRLERALLAAALQTPRLVPSGFDQTSPESFTVAPLRALFLAIIAAGGIGAGAGTSAKAWVDAVSAQVPPGLQQLFDSLAVANLPEDRAEHLPEYCAELLDRLHLQLINRRLTEVKGRLQRTEPSSPEHGKLLGAIVQLEAARRALSTF